MQIACAENGIRKPIAQKSYPLLQKNAAWLPNVSVIQAALSAGNHGSSHQCIAKTE
jgi:hypothetical protein